MDTTDNRAFYLKIYKQILQIAMLASVANIVGNLLTGYPMVANIKWLVVLLVTGLIYRFGMKTANKDNLMFLFVLVIVVGVLPAGWYNAGLMSNNALAYVLLLVIGITILFRGGRRTFLLVLTIAMFILFLIIEQFYPEVLPVYDSIVVFWDRIIQIPLVMIIAAVMLIQFADALYDKQTELEAMGQEFKTMAYTDALTGLKNRAYIFEKLEDLVAKRQDFTVLMIDLDNFKNVNDTYGHLEGDHQLVALAEALKAGFTDKSIIARYGGDEFIIVLFDNEKTIDRNIEKFLDSVRESDICHTFGASISGGYARYRKGLPVDAYIRFIDRTLYEAKGNGKNQILSADQMIKRGI